MAYLGDKRYIKIEFSTGHWTPTVGEAGKVVWTSTSPAAAFTVVKSDGGTQPHVQCPVGSKVTTTHGTAVLEIL